MLRADLHVHSTASDGALTPSELVELALKQRLDVLAIADHDSVAGVTEALSAAEGVRGRRGKQNARRKGRVVASTGSAGRSLLTSVPTSRAARWWLRFRKR